MKKFFGWAAGGIFLLLFQGCMKDRIRHTYSILVPVYKTREAVFGNIKSNLPQAVRSPGKIFIYGQYVFLNETNKGVHVIDNSNPSLPVEKAFIDIPGNLDLAVKGNTLYADMYNDLVAVDITDPLHAKMVKDLPEVFPERSYPNGFIAANGLVIVDWIRKDTTVEEDHANGYILDDRAKGDFLFSLQSGAPSPSQGMAGSMARFSLVGDYLYAVDHHTLKSFSLSQANDPVSAGSINAGWDIETIYPFQDRLFLGSMGGVFIFDISNGGQPSPLGNFVHARACDPVVADSAYAYVTLRAGTSCGPSNNELQIIDVRNLLAPALVGTYPMAGPQGLGKDGNLLFICDGMEGLKIYDASNPNRLQFIKTIGGMEPLDVIPQKQVALVVARDGVYQYNYADPSNIRLLSRIKLSN